MRAFHAMLLMLLVAPLHAAESAAGLSAHASLVLALALQQPRRQTPMHSPAPAEIKACPCSNQCTCEHCEGGDNCPCVGFKVKQATPWWPRPEVQYRYMTPSGPSPVRQGGGVFRPFSRSRALGCST